MKIIINLILFLFPAFSNSQTWSSVGSGMNNTVLGLREYNSELYATGSFTLAGGIQTNNIARWNGTGWDSVGTSPSEGGEVALSVYNGNLYVGGFLLNNSLEQWNGANWSPLSNNTINAPVRVLEVYNGELYVGGLYNSGGSINGNCITKWNGSIWSSLGSGMSFSSPAVSVTALAVYNGELFVGGSFSFAGGNSANNIAKWNGTNWSSVGSGLNAAVRALTVFNGELYAGGYFTTADGNPANYISKWNGSNWSAVGAGMDNTVFALTVYNLELYAGGNFTEADSNPANYIAKWNGTNWSTLGNGTDTTVLTLANFNGDLYVGGDFLSAGGNPSNYIAKWSNTNGINENILSNEINMYPSPATEKIYIQQNKNEQLEISIFDILGKELLKKSIVKMQRVEIPVAELNEGVYIVQVRTAKGILAKKVVVQR